MNQYIYFALGIVLGISLAVYYFMNREEKQKLKAEKKQQKAPPFRSCSAVTCCVCGMMDTLKQ